MFELFRILISQPLYNAIVWFYDVVPGADFGIAIILTTILLKLLMFPLSRKQIESQKKMQELQPKLKAIQREHKDKEAQAKAMMELYRTEKTNPFSGCLPLIVQIVFLIAIYHVIIRISQADFAIDAGELYSFVPNPGTVNHFFLQIVNLAEPNYLLAALAALGQFFQTKMIIQRQPEREAPENGEPDMAAIMNKQMLYIGPAVTLFIGITFPAALSLYWLTSTLFMLGQQYLLLRKEA